MLLRLWSSHFRISRKTLVSAIRLPTISISSSLSRFWPGEAYRTGLIGGYHRSKHSPANSGIHRYPRTRTPLLLRLSRNSLVNR
jgi:hypothetical protein